jgi:hypothetical protein
VQRKKTWTKNKTEKELLQPEDTADSHEKTEEILIFLLSIQKLYDERRICRRKQAQAGVAFCRARLTGLPKSMYMRVKKRKEKKEKRQITHVFRKLSHPHERSCSMARFRNTQRIRTKPGAVSVIIVAMIPRRLARETRGSQVVLLPLRG